MRYVATLRAVRMAIALSVGLSAMNSLNAQSLTWLGTLRGTGSSVASGVSADGSAVVGYSIAANNLRRAFRWTASNNQMQDLGTLGGNQSVAYGVSADGSVVVGWALDTSNRHRAFRWTASNNQMQDLGTLGGNESVAYGVSANGSVVVGMAADTDNRARAFRWVNGTMQNLGAFEGNYSWARGVSADGSAVVGYSIAANNLRRAFRWTVSNNQIQDLGTLGGAESFAYGVSDDGSVVVGYAFNMSGDWRAFRWTASNNQMQDLGTLGGSRSFAFGVSANGAVVVGWASNSSGLQRAFRWTTNGEMEDLNITYASLLTNGSSLRSANAISPDGRYIVGWGYNAATERNEAYLLDTASSCTAHNGDVDESGCVDDADLLAVLFAFGNSGLSLGRVDVNCDGTVDDADLLIVLFNFGLGCGGGTRESVYISDRDAQRGVLRYDIQSNTASTFGRCAQDFCYGIAKHPSDGTIWISRHIGRYIDVLDANGQCIRQIALPQNASNPRGMDIHPTTQKVTVSAGQLYCYDPQTDSWSTLNLPSGVGFPTGVEWNRTGDFLYVTTSTGCLLKYTHSNGCPTTVVAQNISGGGYSADLAVLPNGNILMGRANTIVEMDANCNLVAVRFNLGSNSVTGVAVDSAGTVWATTYENGTLYKSVGSTMQSVLQVGIQKLGDGLIVK